VTSRWPAFTAVLERLGGLQVRNRGTIGGNIANGSPIGDMPPGLIALDTGCLWGGRLTAIRLEDRQVFAVQCPQVQHPKS
jgi:xanthine dehydrogenase iron-sulfur cluster and FAD-binding subunit A